MCHFDFLRVALANMLLCERLPHLVMVTHGLPMVDGLANAALDDEIVRHIGFIFAAIDTGLETEETVRNQRFTESMKLARWFARNAAEPKIPKSMSVLFGEAAGQWSGDDDESRAQTVLEQIARFYLEYKKPWLRDVVRATLNKASSACTLNRLTKSLTTLGKLDSWKSKENIFESIAFAHLKRLLSLDPSLVTKNANIRAALGCECSAKAEEVVELHANKIGSMDAVACTLVALLRGSWRATDIDVERNVVVISLNAPEGIDESETQRAFDSALRKAQDWKNPDRAVAVELVVYLGARQVHHASDIRGVEPGK